MDKHAYLCLEIYIMNKKQFKKSGVFKELKLYKIFTFAFDLRPHLYKTIENAGFVKEAKLKKHCLINEEFKDIIIHSKFSVINKP